MTDANPPANGHTLDAQSADVTPAVSSGTSGIGASAGEETRPAPGSGGAGARQRPPGAASPAGWFPSPAGEAAPPVRNREPVRSGDIAQDADPDPRPTSWYRTPGTLSPGARRLLATTPAQGGPVSAEADEASSNPAGPATAGPAPAGPAPARPAPGGGQESQAPNEAGPVPHWPLITQRGPRNIPVVGPTETLRVRAGRRTPGDAVPPGAVPAPASRTEPSRTEPNRDEPRRSEPNRAEPSQAEPSQAEPSRADFGRAESSRSEPGRRESGWQLAQRAWRDAGRDWETAPGRPPVPGPRQPDAYIRAAYGSDPYAYDPYAAAAYGPGPYAPSANAADRYGGPQASGSYAATYDPDVFAPDPYARDAYPDEYQEDDYQEDDFGIPHRPRAAAPGRYLDEPPAPSFHPAQPTAKDSGWAGEPPDLRYAAAPVIEDARTRVGLWPVQPFPEDLAEDLAGDRADEDFADHETAAPDDDDDDAGPGRDGYPAADPRADSSDRRPQTRADRAAPRRPGAAAPAGDGPVVPTLRYARQPPPLPRRSPEPPPLPRRTPRHAPDWSDEAPGQLPAQPAQDDRSGQVRLPSAPDAAPFGPAPFGTSSFGPASFGPASFGAASFGTGSFGTGSFGSGSFGAGEFSDSALADSDELFRAWQGSVRDAAGVRSRLPAGQSARRRRAWQVAKIGVPAVVIVTVGAGALLMLTGRANEMLAERSSTGTPRTGQATSTTASMILAGYPGMRGGVRVAAMWSDAGTIVAVGTANGHPAIWRRARGGGWPLVSAADLGAMSGHLTSVAHGAAGWIAVGSVTANGMAQPMVYTSADGVTWRTVPSLTAMVRSDAQFLGVAAGRGGYLVVGREGTGKQKFAQLWWSPDLANWTAGGNSGYHNSLAIAAVADGDGFVAAGSQADCHTIWTSPDGTHWTTHDIARPAGAHTATLRYAAAGPGGRVVTAGFATNDAGGIPIVVTTDAGGAHISQVVLPAGGVPGVVTGVTATGGGFVAAGMIGPANAQRAVTWTSADGLTWTAATPVSPAAGTAITALTSSGGHVTGTSQRGVDPAVLTLPAP